MNACARAISFGLALLLPSLATANGPRGPIAKIEKAILPPDFLEDLMLSLARDLYNPEGAKFRNLESFNVVRADGGRESIICIEMNAQSRFGAYTGYKKHLIVPVQGKLGPNWEVRGFRECPE